MIKPLMLIDIDGVVTCQQSAARIDVEQAVVDGDMYAFKPDVWRTVAALIRRDKIEAMWLTSWGDKAHEWELILGLPRLRVVQPYENKDEWWKFARVRDIAGITAGRKIVWIDDYLKEHRFAQEWIAIHGNILGVSPSARTGLTMYQLQEIEAWL